jgi:monoamine oxidase
VVTRWGQDVYARGTHSFVTTAGSAEDYDIMARPTHDDRVFFAGEATEQKHPASLIGAYLSGVRE